MNNHMEGLFDLQGRIAFITGAGGYLGRSMAAALCEAGAHVIINGRTEHKIIELERNLKRQDYSVSTAVFDITNEQQLNNFCNDLEKEYGKLDIIVNNAYAGQTATIETASADDFRSSYETNVIAAFRIIQLCQPLMEKAAQNNIGGASVINIASMYGVVSPDPAIYGDSGQNNPPFYGATKGAIIQLTRYAACHLAKSRIRVNAISPGPFPQGNLEASNPDFYNKLCRKNPMHRIGYPDELAGPLLFLASDASSFITGINLPVDGGWTAW